MAMTLRLPAALDAALELAAQEQRVSKQSYVISAVERALRQEDKTARVLASLDETSESYAGLIKRLEDA
ncbi:MAG TPA: toxin-antitoxin system HicB family antitoxin [Microbacteriaceae bacterium]|nr:toxin-antitoxin system HicB family antitoxin [Microbacteriaceae bacterium]